jgi:hypothetical protein
MTSTDICYLLCVFLGPWPYGTSLYCYTFIFLHKKINFLWCLLCFGVYIMLFLEEEQKEIFFFMKEQTGTFNLDCCSQPSE